MEADPPAPSAPFHRTLRSGDIMYWTQTQLAGRAGGGAYVAAAAALGSTRPSGGGLCGSWRGSHLI